MKLKVQGKHLYFFSDKFFNDSCIITILNDNYV